MVFYSIILEIKAISIKATPLCISATCYTRNSQAWMMIAWSLTPTANKSLMGCIRTVLDTGRIVRVVMLISLSISHRLQS